jgi:hypothetical protein
VPAYNATPQLALSSVGLLCNLLGWQSHHKRNEPGRTRVILKRDINRRKSKTNEHQPRQHNQPGRTPLCPQTIEDDNGNHKGESNQPEGNEEPENRTKEKNGKNEPSEYSAVEKSHHGLPHLAILF